MTISDGEIRYSAPDRGLYQINGDHIRHFSGLDGDGKPLYQKRDQQPEFGEKWICDGASVFEFQAAKKTLVQMQLPPEMRGKAIADGPLPFLFGSSADKLLDRYWIHELSPSQAGSDDLWLEAFPKRPTDAAEYRAVKILLDAKQFVPKAMELTLPNSNQTEEKPRQVYRFDKIRVNDVRDNLQKWLGELIDPDVPRGWKKVVENYEQFPTAGTSPPRAARIERRPAPRR